MTDQPQPPDEVTPPDGGDRRFAEVVKEAALMLPNIVKLIGRLLTDPRVPRRSKIALGIASAYAVSPIDLIPEFIPVIGWADDILVVLYAIDTLVDRAGPGLVEEHWDGPGDVLALVQDVMGLARGLIPRRVTTILDRLVG
jgi:uncharacterized membrane protein YkvA (DUF1232 family)